jgi:hypothetical protein
LDGKGCGKRRVVVVDIEFEEVKERVYYEVDCAVEFCMKISLSSFGIRSHG